jgi:hypothetical protein
MIRISEMQGQHLENSRKGVSGWASRCSLDRPDGLGRKSVCAAPSEHLCENESLRGLVCNPVQTPV